MKTILLLGTAVWVLNRHLNLLPQTEVLAGLSLNSTLPISWIRDAQAISLVTIFNFSFSPPIRKSCWFPL